MNCKIDTTPDFARGHKRVRNLCAHCYSATIDEIEQKGWSLVPSKYIEFKNCDEQIDFDTKMRQLQTEMRDLLQQEEASNKELKSLFEKLGYSL